MDFLAFRMSQTEETTIPPELWHYGKCFLGPCFVNELKRVCNNDHWRLQFSQFSRSVVSDSLKPHESQHARPPCPSPTPRVYSNSHPSSQWCHPALSSSVIPFSSCSQSLQATGSFPMSQLFEWGGQSTGVSVSVLPMNTQDRSPLGPTGWISLQSKGLSRVFSKITVQKHQLFGAQLSFSPAICEPWTSKCSSWF